jgi:SAM-dependent methyltransferase
MDKYINLIKDYFSRRFSTFNYKEYWNNRYAKGGNSGDGSYGELARFKADFINNLIETQQLKSVIEFGCGDGNNLALYKTAHYLGFDIAQSAIALCCATYANDATKSFLLYDPKLFKNQYIKADLVLSLDVLYHIISEDDYVKSLDDLFATSNRFVLLYTNIQPLPYEQEKGAWVKRRDTLNYLKKYKDFKLIQTQPNPFPEKSWADFLLLEKKQ